jgi:hypothetical protein
MSELKALLIRAQPEIDLGNILQIARSEGMKIFHNPQKIKVLELLNSRYGYVVVVQNSDGSIAEDTKKK